MLFKAAERIGQLIALLAGIALFLIVIDQGRHFLDSQYTETQRTKHSFMCYHHGRVLSIPPDANKLVKKQLRIQQNVYELMDVVQQENAPVEFWGKLRQFALCSSFAKAGFGGFEATGVKVDEQSVMKIGPEDADILIGKIVILTSSYRDFPERASAKLKCELVRLKALEEETECSSEGNIIFVGSGTDTDGPSGPPPPIDITDPPVVSPAEPEDVWLLVTGADQDDKDAENQANKIRNILETVQPPIMDAPVELRLIRSWRRTVIVFDNKEDASTALERLRRKLPYGGYLRQQSKWCPDLGEHDDINKIPTKNCVTS